MTPEEVMDDLRKRVSYLKNPEQAKRYMDYMKASYNALAKFDPVLEREKYLRDVKTFQRDAAYMYSYLDRNSKRDMQDKRKSLAYGERRDRQMSIGKLRVGNRSDLFAEARSAVNAFGGADKAKLLATLDLSEKLSNQGIGNGVGTARNILKQMQNREKAKNDLFSPFRMRHKDQYWQYKTPREWMNYGNNLVDELVAKGALDYRQGDARKVDLKNAYKRITKEGKSPFKDVMQSIINDTDREKSWSAAEKKAAGRLLLNQIVAGTKPQNYMGVERIVNFAHKGEVKALISDLRDVVRWIPGGGQYKNSLNALEARLGYAVTPESQRQLATDMGQLASRIYTSSKGIPEAHIAYSDALARRGLEAQASMALSNAEIADVTGSRLLNYHYRKQALKRNVGKFSENLFAMPGNLGGLLYGRGLFFTKDGGREDKLSSLFSSYDAQGNNVKGRKAIPLHLKAIGREYGNAFAGIWRNFTSVIRDHQLDLAKDLAKGVLPILQTGFQIASTGSMIGLGVVGAGVKAMAQYGIQSSNRRIGLKNTYNLSVPTSWKGGKSYEDFEQQSFADAQALRMGPYALQDAILRMALSTSAARYVTGPNIGTPVVTSLDQASRIAKNMALMARVTNTSEADLAGIMIQIQQGIGKGKFDIMDIKPMENRSIAFTHMWAREALGLPGGASELFRLMAEGAGDRTKGITAERAIQGMMNEKLTKKLEAIMAGTARTWEQVGVLAAGHLNRGALSFTKQAEFSAGGGLGTRILEATRFISEEPLTESGKTLGDILIDLMPSLKDIPGLLNRGKDALSSGLEIAAKLTGLFSPMIPALVMFGRLLLSINGVILSVLGFLTYLPGMIWNVIKGEDPFSGHIGATLWRGAGAAFATSDAIGESGVADKLEKLALEIGRTEHEWSEALKPIRFGSKPYKNETGDDTLNATDVGLTGPVAQIAKDTHDIKKNGAKLTSVQLELLKQVAGRNIVNSVTRVSPNIVANVGTIKSGVEYEQFMADLNKSVRLATMNMAY